VTGSRRGQAGSEMMAHVSGRINELTAKHVSVMQISSRPQSRTGHINDWTIGCLIQATASAEGCVVPQRAAC